MKVSFLKSNYVKFSTSEEHKIHGTAIEMGCTDTLKMEKVSAELGLNNNFKSDSGLSAGICYCAEDYEKLKEEEEETSLARFNQTMSNKHHSVAGHTHVSMILKGIPKILAMLLNNEKEYNTSEKSGRYTVMLSDDPVEDKIYKKWVKNFELIITSKYPDKFNDATVKSKAQENARYQISVFTPTTMEYTTSVRQLNYTVQWALDYVITSGIEGRLKGYLTEFAEQVKTLLEINGLYNEHLTDERRSFSLFGDINEIEDTDSDHYGSSYETRYNASLASLAQQHRNRCVWYIIGTEAKGFYVPPILRGTPYEEEWIVDGMSGLHNYPQGMLVPVLERGTWEAFRYKCYERNCGQAQTETALQVVNTGDLYVKNCKSAYVLSKIEPLHNRARCCFTVDPHVCKKPCVWGCNGINRDI